MLFKKCAGIKDSKGVVGFFFSLTVTSPVVLPLLYLQKKANLSLLEQERQVAKEEVLHQERLKEEERKISVELEESKKVCCVFKSL